MGIAAENKVITGIYSPYLNILGGGEKYILDIASFFSHQGINVEIVFDKNFSPKKAERKFKIDLSKISFIPYQKLKFGLSLQTKKYKYFFYVTDGSLFFSMAKHNFLIVQSPSHIPKLSTLRERLKFFSWHKIVCYSDYVAFYIKERLKKNANIVPPGVNVEEFKPRKKRNIILSVGRFFSHLHSKKQHLLIKVFKEIIRDSRFQDWQLVLIGSQDSSKNSYLKYLYTISEGYPVKILIDVEFSVLKKYYQQSSIFWLATGLGEDLIKHPERGEHFGIVVVEAMAAGCVPLVYKTGGPAFIVENSRSGLLFKDQRELFELTKRLILNDKLRLEISRRAIKRSERFDMKNFFRELSQII